LKSFDKLKALNVKPAHFTTKFYFVLCIINGMY